MSRIFVIATDHGFVGYDGHGELHYTKGFSFAEPYFSYQQAEIAAGNIGVQPFWILTEGEKSETQRDSRISKRT